MTSATLISIDDIDFSEYASRGVTQTLEPIEAAKQMRRTINGELLDISAPQFRKFKSTVTCSDQEAPSLSDVWPGKTVSVVCLPDMHDTTGSALSLTMRVMNWNTKRDEWGAEVSWQIDLEEV
jgi:hypothetical protein